MVLAVVSAFCEVAPHLNSSNLLVASMKRVILIDKLVKQIMRQVGAIVDDDIKPSPIRATHRRRIVYAPEQLDIESPE